MADPSRLTLHWVSFLLHCGGVLMLLFSFSIPFWLVRNDGANEYERFGLWVRCRLGGGCDPYNNINEDMAMNMTPIQVLMSVGMAASLVSLVFYGLWLWKGEMCDTPWEKRCTWCRETYTRSRKPKTSDTDKFRSMKWAAFGFSFTAGALTATASIIFMVNALIKNEGKIGQVGWCSWLTLVASILLLVKNGVISLCVYVLRVPENNPETEEDFYNMCEVENEKEEERIRRWIMEQRNGLDNPSFTREWDYPKNNSIYSIRSGKSIYKGSNLYYKGQNNPSVLDCSGGSIPSTLESVASKRGSIPLHYHPKPPKPGTSGAMYAPMYSMIFRGKIPMIPKKHMTPKEQAIYDTIYRFRSDDEEPTYYDHYESIGEMQRGRHRPSTHLGITSSKDDMTRTRRDNSGRRMSDSNVIAIPHRPGEYRIKSKRRRDSDDSSQSSRSTTPSPLPLQPGKLPEAYRRRKHPERRSTPSLVSGTSHDQSHASQDPNSSFAYRVRTRTADESQESIDIPLSMVLSHGMPNLDMTSSSEYTVDNIWVVPKTEDIPEVIGKGRVHFKLHQSIQELDKLDGIDETIEETTEA